MCLTRSVPTYGLHLLHLGIFWFFDAIEAALRQHEIGCRRIHRGFFLIDLFRTSARLDMSEVGVGNAEGGLRLVRFRQ